MHSIRLSSPARPLREYVRFYANRSVRTCGDLVVCPVPARAFPLIEFVFGDRFQVLYPSQSRTETSPRAAVVGLQTHCRSQLQFRGSAECFVILFEPTGLHRLFSIPARDLTDRSYEARCVLGAFVSQLEEALGGTSKFEERVRIADRFLLPHSSKVRSFERISGAASEIFRTCGCVRIIDLANNVGLSARQFERCFMEQVGVQPKLYARIVRFEAALDRKARSSAKSWTDVAHEFGYYDQMHMVHDFEGFTGGTPTRILREVEMLFREQIHAVRSGRRLTTSAGDLQLIL
jgi:AraC-like DNA-binding protein